MEEGEQVGGYNTGNQEYRGGRGGKGFAEDAPHLPIMHLIIIIFS